MEKSDKHLGRGQRKDNGSQIKLWTNKDVEEHHNEEQEEEDEYEGVGTKSSEKTNANTIKADDADSEKTNITC
ncbi:hypothetical protein QE152_g35723 [Popillia japonica]|uniref:Uncharacterized protein n=1 Tax=Popillia japonica TaxID=7064 RepID=A0AAW1IFB4_POPJA